MVDKLAFKGLVVLSMGTVALEPRIVVVVVSQHMEFAREMIGEIIIVSSFFRFYSKELESLAGI